MFSDRRSPNARRIPVPAVVTKAKQSKTYLWEFLKKILLSRVVGTTLRDTTLVAI
jgi:hypothetical protein